MLKHKNEMSKVGKATAIYIGKVCSVVLRQTWFYLVAGTGGLAGTAGLAEKCVSELFLKKSQGEWKEGKRNLG